MGPGWRHLVSEDPRCLDYGHDQHPSPSRLAEVPKGLQKDQNLSAGGSIQNTLPQSDETPRDGHIAYLREHLTEGASLFVAGTIDARR